MWDTATQRAAAHDSPGISEALEGRYSAEAVEIGADGEVLAQGRLEGSTAFTLLAEHMRPYSPAWAAGVCDVPEATIRGIANDYLFPLLLRRPQ